MQCEKIDKYIQEHLDGNLNQEQEELLTSHLAKCASCKQEFDAYSHLYQELNNLAEPKLDYSLVDGLLANLVTSEADIKVKSLEEITANSEIENNAQSTEGNKVLSISKGQASRESNFWTRYQKYIFPSFAAAAVFFIAFSLNGDLLAPKDEYAGDSAPALMNLELEEDGLAMTRQLAEPMAAEMKFDDSSDFGTEIADSSALAIMESEEPMLGLAAKRVGQEAGSVESLLEELDYQSDDYHGLGDDRYYSYFIQAIDHEEGTIQLESSDGEIDTSLKEISVKLDEVKISKLTSAAEDEIEISTSDELALGSTIGVVISPEGIVKELYFFN